MAIHFTCSCGKQLQAREEFAGRKMRCPDCGEELTIPSADADELPPIPAVSVSGIGTEAPLESEPATSGIPSLFPVSDTAPPVSVRRKNQGQVSSSFDQNITPWAENLRERVGEFAETAEGGGGRRWLLGLLLVLLFGGGGAAAFFYGDTITEKYRHLIEVNEPAATPWSHVTDLEMINKNSEFMASFRVAELWNSPARDRILKAFFPGQDMDAAKLKEMWGLAPDEIERISIFAPWDASVNLANPHSVFILVRTKEPYNRYDLQTLLIRRRPTAKLDSLDIGVLRKHRHMSVAFLNPQTLLFASTAYINQIHDYPPLPRVQGHLREARRLAEEGKPVVVGMDLSFFPKYQLVNMTLPGWNELLKFTKSAASHAVTMNPADSSDITIHLRYKTAKDGAAAAAKAKKLQKQLMDQLSKALQPAADPNAAAALAEANRTSALATVGAALAFGPLQAIATKQATDKHLAAMKMELAKKQAAAKPSPALLREQALVKSLKISREERRMTFTMTFPDKQADPLQLFADLMRYVHTTAQQRSGDNLRQIAQAMQNYHNTYGKFPRTVVGNGLSWRVALLPFLEQQALYKKFNFQEPWQHPFNLHLMSQMPDVYAPPITFGKMRRKTYYQVFEGPDAAFEPERSIKLTDFEDGTTNTILILEAPVSKRWLKPGDLRYPGEGPPRMQGLGTTHFWAAFADGSVRPLPVTIEYEDFVKKITRRGDKKKK